MSSIPLQTSDYRALRQKDLDLEDDAPDGEENPHLEPQTQGRDADALAATRLSTLSSNAATPWIVHALLVLLNIFTFAYLLQRSPSDAACTQHLSSWSPAIDAGAVRYKTIPINGSIDLANQYKGKPSAEIDAAWTNITTAVPKLRLSGSDLGRLKKSAVDGTYKEEKEEPSSSGYVAQLAVYELLGCLDMLRRASYRWEYPEMREGTEGFDEEDWHREMDHCTDILRVQVMCKSDVDVLTYTDSGENEQGVLRPDFSGVKKCRDFDEIRAWSYQHGKGGGLSTTDVPNG